ncbi:MAG: ABC transporter ATP-binding protein [Myxococcota bacterium]|nr:ABC transporter ATP-binding protein [Myxococcota bacterium]
MNKKISIEGVSKAYLKGQEKIPVLRDASFSIAFGEMVAVVGASGAGKSTLLHLMGGLDEPDGGVIRYGGTCLSSMSAEGLADFRNQQLGFVFQFHHLLPEFSALENVMMPGLIARHREADIRSAAEKAIEVVGLSRRLGHKPGELSGGEQQRVALARALVLRPPVLLADEVTGNLDEKTGEEIHDLLFRLNRDFGTTIVVVTHNKSLAFRMPRMLRLIEGKVEDVHANS